MIDIHSHILWGVDDGPMQMEQSIAMLRLAADSGTTDIVASPHSNSQFRFDAELIEDKIAELRQACGPSPRIHFGCDFHLNPENIRDAITSPARYTIDHGAYILVEFADLLIPKNTEGLFGRLRGVGIAPIITHPERNELLSSDMDRIALWVEAGCFLQLTAYSFLGRFGDSARSACHELMRRRLVHIVASDAHDVEFRPPVLNTAYNHVAEHYGQETADLLFVENPNAVLASFPLDTPAEPARKPRWWSKFTCGHLF